MHTNLAYLFKIELHTEIHWNLKLSRGYFHVFKLYSVIFVCMHFFTCKNITFKHDTYYKYIRQNPAKVIQSQKYKLFGEIYSQLFNLWSFLWSAKIVRIKKATVWNTSSELCNIIAQLIEA